MKAEVYLNGKSLGTENLGELPFELETNEELLSKNYCAVHEDINVQLLNEANAWRSDYPEQPVMLTEFGADAVAGMHSAPPTMLSEKYQLESLDIYAASLDSLDYICGEHV